MKPAFKPNSLVAVGNSSEMNDGAVAVVLVSVEKMKQVKKLAEWLGGTLEDIALSIMGIGIGQVEPHLNSYDQ